MPEPPVASGGNNNGIAGNGGNGLTAAGNGGRLDGGRAMAARGARWTVKTPPVVTPMTQGQVINIVGNKPMNFNGGNGGSMTGSSGNGGNGTALPGSDSVGGNGGMSLASGSGGPGGSITLQALGGTVIMLSQGASVNGGDDGSYFATSGNGGNSTGSKPGGRGGDSGGQGDGGGGVPFNPLVMTITIETGSFTLAQAATLSANGGNALDYQNTPGNGGNGGIRGGDGGDGGVTGSGGLGGTVQLTISNHLVVDGLITANGGERNPMSVSSGNGGNGGTFAGSGGGDGGMILKSGSAGGGGIISLTSTSSNVTSTAGNRTLLANGGDVGFVDENSPAPDDD